jgi:chorismate synthase
MNSFGRVFRISIFGESHGECVGITIDGCPAGIKIEPSDLEADLARRRAGAKGTSPRTESDNPRIVSGVFNNYTSGAPITILFENKNIDSSSYELLKDTPRPGHSDFVAYKKYHAFNDYRGGGHFSGRLTVALVAAGVLAKKIIAPININAKLISVRNSGHNTEQINAEIERAMLDGDSVGGVIECRAQGLKVGLGEPFFDSCESLISHLAFSIPAIKGIEFGAGFNSAKMLGSEMRDQILDSQGRTTSNNAGGISAGISNGNELVFRVAVKPTSSIKKPISSINLQSGQPTEISVSGRHDACIALRVPVVLEAITACVIADLNFLTQERCED